MAKFEVRLKLQGLELEIKGEREDIPRLTRNLSEQLAGVLTPTALIAESKEPKSVQNEENGEANAPDADATRRRKPARQRRAKERDAQDAAALDWRHDPGKWGVPQQGWSVADKSLWLLYVVTIGEKLRDDLSGPSIASTFNKHFKQAGTVHPPHVTKDLGRLKATSPAFVGENTTLNPSTWFLTQEGIKKGEQLVNDAKGTDAPE